MKINKVLISAVAFILAVCQLTGCAGTTQDEMSSLVNSEPTIEMEVPVLSGETSEVETSEVEIIEEQAKELVWTYLARMSTYSDVRKEVNSALEIVDNTGSIYVDLEGNHELNNTLYNALRNDTFVNKQLNNEETVELLRDSVLDVFTDVEYADAMAAMFNSYWDLLPEFNGEETTEFNGSAPLTRAQAMTLVMRATTQVTEDGKPKSNAEFEKAVGDTPYTDFAAYLNDNCYINTDDNSLTEENFNGTMTRAEYIYMVMKTVYGDEINTFDVSKVAMSDCVDGGSISSEQGYTSNNGRALTLEFMLNNPDGGLETSLYKAVAKAVDLAIITAETRWDEPVTKTEAIEILVDTVSSLPTVTEETVGYNEDELREHGKEWYNRYKDEITCNEETFVNEFVEYVVSGSTEVDAAREVYLTYLKIRLQEPAQTEVVVTPIDDGSDVAEVVVKPVTTTATTTTAKPTESTKPTESKPAESKPETKPTANDYSNIKWGDPLPDNLTNKRGKKATKVKWKETEGGKFVKIDGGYYYSIQDWADGKGSLDMDVVEGKTIAEMVKEQGVVKWD